MSDRSRERKVRGSRIQSSRDEKRETQHKERESADTRQTIRTGTDVSDQFVPDEQTFVETDAVRRMKRRLERWMDVGRPVHLIGPTGCGKTALAMQTARDRDRPVVWINGDADLTTSDLVGEYGETERISERDKYIHNVVKSKDIIRDRWVDNPLTLAVKEGATLVYNEFSRTKPIANNVLLSVLEEGMLELPGQRGESRYVDVHPEFRAILTSNSVEYAGVHEPQDALLDRLVGIHMDFYDHETEAAIVRSNVDEADQAQVDQTVTLVRRLRDRLEINVGTRAAIMAVEGTRPVDELDEQTFGDICVDVLASKVSSLDDIAGLREEVEAAIRETKLPFVDQ
ncbi:gas vesicle protein GvpN [Halorubrum sp. RMP-47]|uniref:Gas vesicle protein GvpN n=1 Tax=Halorubrum miltondacostae TaxID=3076378 RepID=A0ABD5M3S4_9EURY